MNCILMGGAGYLGGRLAGCLKAGGHQTVIVDCYAPEHLPPGLPCEQFIWTGEAGYRQELARAVRHSEMVFNLAGLRQKDAERRPLDSLHLATDINLQLLTLIGDEHPSCGYIFLSSIHAFGSMKGELKESSPLRPTNIYGLSKKLGEEVVAYSRARFQSMALSVRLSNSFGYPVNSQSCDWAAIVNDFASQGLAQGVINLQSSGEQERNFITLSDATRALVFLAENSRQWPADGVINLGNPVNKRIIDMVNLVAERCESVSGQRPEICRPDPDAHAAGDSFTFNVERLYKMGFAWEQPFTAEIDGLLEFMS